MSTFHHFYSILYGRFQPVQKKKKEENKQEASRLEKKTMKPYSGQQGLQKVQWNLQKNNRTSKLYTSLVRLENIRSIRNYYMLYPSNEQSEAEMLKITTYSFSSVAQLCPTLCNPMDRSTPGLSAHHQLPELAQTHVHQVGDAIQPSHPLPSPSLPTFNLSQH